MIMLRKTILISIGYLLPFFVMGQQEAEQKIGSLKDSYQELYSKSENYNDYKVIKSTRLNAFWKSVDDSLGIYKAEIRTNRSEIAGLKGELNRLEEKQVQLENDLDKAVARADGISVFGFLMHKNTYNLIVWGIILGLGVAIFFLFGSQLRSKRLYKTTRKEFKDLVEEFEDYRKKSYDKKIKMGRELQTERNKVEELKNKLALEKGKMSTK